MDFAQLFFAAWVLADGGDERYVHDVVVETFGRDGGRDEGIRPRRRGMHNRYIAGGSLVCHAKKSEGGRVRGEPNNRFINSTYLCR